MQGLRRKGWRRKTNAALAGTAGCHPHHWTLLPPVTAVEGQHVPFRAVPLLQHAIQRPLLDHVPRHPSQRPQRGHSLGGGYHAGPVAHRESWGAGLDHVLPQPSAVPPHPSPPRDPQFDKLECTPSDAADPNNTFQCRAAPGLAAGSNGYYDPSKGPRGKIADPVYNEFAAKIVWAQNMTVLLGPDYAGRAVRVSPLSDFFKTMSDTQCGEVDTGEAGCATQRLAWVGCC